MSRLLSLIALALCACDLAPIRIEQDSCGPQSPCAATLICHEGYCLLPANVCLLDGQRSASEACDDGNENDQDGCTSDCQLARCGDGVLRTDLEPGELGYEACEPSLVANGAYCSPNCRLEIEPVRLATGPRFACLASASTITCWGDAYDQGSFAPTSRFLAIGTVIEDLAVMKAPLDNRSGGAISPLLMVQVSPGITRMVPWVGARAELYFWDQNSGRDVRDRAERSIASDHRGIFRRGQDEDRAWCWVNPRGKLSCTPSGDCRARPRPAMDVSDSGLSNPEGTDLTRLGLIRDVALARAVTCAVKDSGGLLCWGDLQGWGLPDNSRCANEYSLTPGGHEPETPVPGLSDVIKLSAGEHAMLALLEDGSVAEWGWDWTLETAIDSPVIHRFDERVVGLAASKQTRCVLFASGGVGCWGKNRGLASGAGAEMGMVELPPVQQLSQGWDDDYVCALTRDERVFCWGSNAMGQLGDSGAHSGLTPIEVPLGASGP